MGIRQDFLLREIARLRQMVAALLKGPRLPANTEEALRTAFDLQIKLFPLPAAQFLALDAAEQFERLKQNLPDEIAAEKCTTYAELLAHTATLYDYSDRATLGFGARQLALTIALLTEESFRNAEARGLIVSLASQLDRTTLAAPVLEQLESFERHSR